MRRLLVAMAATLFCAAVGTPALAGFVNRVYRDAGGAHRYAVFVPENYTTRRAWPVVLFLHGAGERGTDGLRPTTVGLGPVIRRDPKSFPFIAVFPQCENLRGRLFSSWNADSADGRRALQILKDVESAYRIDPKRRILTGWSMGGSGAWSLAADRPGFWSAVVPLSGGGDTAAAKRLRNVPVWAFHGEDDRLVLQAETRKMVDAVKSAGGNAQFTRVKGIGHDAWKAVYSHPPLLQWMQNPAGRVSRPAEIVATDSQRSIARNDELVPFVPAVEISRAVTVRVGNDVLESLSYSVPQMVDPKRLSGRIDDIKDMTFTDGHTFNLEFIGVTYAAALVDAEIQARRGNRLRVRLGLQNVTLRISKTHVIGTRRWAAAGPMQITIGRRRPAWLTLELQPHVEKRSFKFRTLTKSFEIEDDNWQVDPPTTIEVHGSGLTKKNVSDRLVSGLKERKERIQKEVLAVVPSVVREIEQKLAVPDATGPIAGLWPLPVYRPRLQIWPETAAVDERGLTVTFGVTAAAIDPSQAPKTPKRVASPPVPSSARPERKGVQVGIAPEILTALTQLLIDADVARLHVADVPSSPFADFLDPAVMAAILPDLKRFGPKRELSSELMFRKPLTVAPRSAAGNRRRRAGNGKNDKPPGDANSPAGAVFEIPEGMLAIAVRTSADAEWKPYAEFTIRLSHPLSIGAKKAGFTHRAADIQWKSDPTITVQGRFANGVEPQDSKIDADRVRQIFARGWRNWSASFGSNPRVPDVVFGEMPLRLERLEWTDRLVATFAVPGVRISNRSNSALTYEVKGPNSKWGGPYTLPPGRAHEFDVPYSLVFRQSNGREPRQYTLPAGSHSAYRAPRSGGPVALYLAE